MLMVNLSAAEFGSTLIPTLPNTDIQPLKDWNTSFYVGNEFIMPVVGVLTRDKGMNVEFDFRAGVFPADVGLYGVGVSCSKLFAHQYQDKGVLSNRYMGLGPGLTAVFVPPGFAFPVPKFKVFFGTSTSNYFLDVGVETILLPFVFGFPIPTIRFGIMR